MKKSVIAIVALYLMLLLPQTVFAQSDDFSAALARMDAIIKQMRELRDEFAQIAASISGQTPALPMRDSGSDTILGEDIRYGQTSEDIARIQRLLATDAEIYPYGVDSGFFGPKTQEAIRRLQLRFNLDPVGVIGPATKTLLESFFAAYPNEKYPADVLKKGVPRKLKPSGTVLQSASVPSIGVLQSVSVSEEDGEFIVRSYRKDGKRNRDLIIYTDSTDTLITRIAQKLGAAEEEVRRLMKFTDGADNTRKETTDNALGDIKRIVAEVGKKEAKVTVRYNNSERRTFTVEDDDPQDIIDAVADELKRRADDVAKVLRFEYGDIQRVVTKVSDLDGKIRVRIYFTSGADVKRVYEKGTEVSDIVKDISRTLDVSRSALEREIDLE